MRENRHEGCVRASALALTLLVAACGSDAASPTDDPDAGTACELADEIASLAGPDAKDCGTVPFGGDVATAYACAIESFVAGTRFFVTFDLGGMDSQVRSAIVGGPDGVVSILRYDSCPMGCGDGHHDIHRATCADPFVLKTRSADVLACSAVVAPHHVCGAFAGAVGYADNLDGKLSHVPLTVHTKAGPPYPAPTVADFDAGPTEDAGQQTDSTRVSSPKADLHLSKPIKLLTPVNAAPGDLVSLTFAVDNKGGTVAGVFEVAVLLSKDGSLSPGAPLVHATAVAFGTGKKAGPILFDANNPLSFTLPAGISDGAWWILVSIDHKEAIPELDEGNNLGHATSLLQVDKLLHILPDLTISDLAMTVTDKCHLPGEVLTYQLVIANAGPGDASSVEFALFLSKDKKLQFKAGATAKDIDAWDLKLTNPQTSTVSFFKGLAKMPLFEVLTVPKAPAGKFWLIAAIDPADTVKESDEGNNTLVHLSPLELAGDTKCGVDLALLTVDLKPSAAPAGGKLDVQFTVKNTGKAPSPIFETKVYFCPTQNLSKVICVSTNGVDVAPVGVGSSSTSASQLQVPNITSAKVWYVFVVLDPANKIAELNETNNQGWEVLTVK